MKSIAILGVLVITSAGQRQEFTYAEAWRRAVSGEQAFIQAIGEALPERAKTYLEITQHRDGNSTTDSAIERVELGR